MSVLPYSRRVLAVLACAGLMGLASCAAGEKGGDQSEGAGGDTFDIAGTVQVQSVSNGKVGSACRPDQSSVDQPARPGSQTSGVEVDEDVTVTDASGEVVGLGKVLIGEYIDSGYELSSYCTMPFEVKGVPDGDKFYGVAVASLPIERYARADLDQPIRIEVPEP